MELTGCLRCDTGMHYYVHDHRRPPAPGTEYLSTVGEPEVTTRDYKIVAVFDDGSTQEQYCETATDVENHTVQFVRQGVATQSKTVTLTIANLWLTE